MERLLINKELKRKITLLITPYIGYLIIRLIYLSCKKKYILPKNKLENKPYIIAFWHRKLLMQPFLYKTLKKKPKVVAMISEHFDGEVISKIIRYFHFKSIRGSTRKGAIKVLKNAFSKINEGYDVAITPDGPKGPKYSVADGIISISQKKDIMIVACSYNASSYWEFNSWDNFIVPKPFSTLNLVASEPFCVKDLSKEEAKKKIKNKLLSYEEKI